MTDPYTDPAYNPRCKEHDKSIRVCKPCRDRFTVFITPYGRMFHRSPSCRQLRKLGEIDYLDVHPVTLMRGWQVSERACRVCFTDELRFALKLDSPHPYKGNTWPKFG